MARFLRSNLAYIIWFAFYFVLAWLMLGHDWTALAITAVIYGVSIGIALSPVGEVLLRWFQHIRPIQTREETEYLQPIFDEVYENAKEQFPKLSDNIKLYIDDTMTVNAFAIGRNTVALTKGAVATFSQDELKGVLAHEFGHLANGDTKALLLNTIGNGVFTLYILFAKILMTAFVFVLKLFSGDSDMSLIFKFFKFIFEAFGFVVMFVGQIILSISSRQAEYYADYFSYEIGMSQELIQALYILQKVSISGKVPLMERLKASHPNLAGRIAKLEQLEVA